MRQFPLGPCASFLSDRAPVSSRTVRLFPLGPCACFLSDRAPVSSRTVRLFPLGPCACFLSDRAPASSWLYNFRLLQLLWLQNFCLPQLLRHRLPFLLWPPLITELHWPWLYTFAFFSSSASELLPSSAASASPSPLLFPQPVPASTSACLNQCLPQPVPASTSACLSQCLPQPVPASTSACLNQCLPQPVPASPVPASPVPASPVPASPVPASPVPASPVPAKGLTPVLDIEPAVVSLALLPAVLASSPTGLVSSSAALALMFIERFQFTAAGKLLVDRVQIDLSATASTALLVATGQPPVLVFEPAVVSSVSVVPMLRFQLTTAGKLLLAASSSFSTVLSAPVLHSGAWVMIDNGPLDLPAAGLYGTFGGQGA